MDHFAEIFIALQKLDNQEDLDAEGSSSHHSFLLDLHVHTLYRKEKTPGNTGPMGGS